MSPLSALAPVWSPAKLHFCQPLPILMFYPDPNFSGSEPRGGSSKHQSVAGFPPAFGHAPSPAPHSESNVAVDAMGAQVIHGDPAASLFATSSNVGGSKSVPPGRKPKAAPATRLAPGLKEPPKLFDLETLLDAQKLVVQPRPRASMDRPISWQGPASGTVDHTVYTGMEDPVGPSVDWAPSFQLSMSEDPNQSDLDWTLPPGDSVLAQQSSGQRDWQQWPQS